MEILYPNLQVVNGNKLIFTRAKLSLNTDEKFFQTLKSRLKIRRAENVSFVRVGQNGDGGYIMADDFRKGGGIAYSFGISTEISWDLAMSQRDYDIFMYDMTIDGLPMENEKFHFFKEGIGGTTDKEKSLDTLENFIKRNGHENNSNMILKMDVEGAEWDFLENVSSSTLNQFDQLLFEFHDLTRYKTDKEMIRTISLINKINLTHTLVHLHGNNFGHYINSGNFGVIPDVLELTYLRTANHQFHDDKKIFLPTKLDCPNGHRLPDIPLGYWNKFNWI